MEERIQELLRAYRVPAEDADRIDLIARLALRVASAEQRLERVTGELIAAAERGLELAKKGDLRKTVRGQLTAGAVDKAGAYDAVLMEVAERRAALGLAAEMARLKRPKPAASAAVESPVRRAVVLVGWDGASRPIYRYRDEMDLADAQRSTVAAADSSARDAAPTDEPTAG
ncbi:hypothetical protein [Micromonospora sp. WMMD1082]|uniref:hypothetical protein n=1 Tax=Micromonospora sp. WMMD1082 TaxID=3016104 RepID=UPI0024170E3A|nr:hypothetical protein [Micromonospora sp. WMMD1082]MDG4796944.1 hypothetical protein [Micromonospora sp. WMMD1082]